MRAEARRRDKEAFKTRLRANSKLGGAGGGAEVIVLIYTSRFPSPLKSGRGSLTQPRLHISQPEGLQLGWCAARLDGEERHRGADCPESGGPGVLVGLLRDQCSHML